MNENTIQLPPSSEAWRKSLLPTHHIAIIQKPGSLKMLGGWCDPTKWDPATVNSRKLASGPK